MIVSARPADSKNRKVVTARLYLFAKRK